MIVAPAHRREWLCSIAIGLCLYMNMNAFVETKATKRAVLSTSPVTPRHDRTPPQVGSGCFPSTDTGSDIDDNDKECGTESNMAAVQTVKTTNTSQLCGDCIPSEDEDDDDDDDVIFDDGSSGSTADTPTAQVLLGAAPLEQSVAPLLVLVDQVNAVRITVTPRASHVTLITNSRDKTSRVMTPSRFITKAGDSSRGRDSGDRERVQEQRGEKARGGQGRGGGGEAGRKGLVPGTGRSDNIGDSRWRQSNVQETLEAAVTYSTRSFQSGAIATQTSTGIADGQGELRTEAIDFIKQENDVDEKITPSEVVRISTPIAILEQPRESKSKNVAVVGVRGVVGGPWADTTSQVGEDRSAASSSSSAGGGKLATSTNVGLLVGISAAVIVLLLVLVVLIYKRRRSRREEGSYKLDTTDSLVFDPSGVLHGSHRLHTAGGADSSAGAVSHAMIMTMKNKNKKLIREWYV